MVLYISAISATNGSSGFGSDNKQEIDIRTVTHKKSQTKRLALLKLTLINLQNYRLKFVKRKKIMGQLGADSMDSGDIIDDTNSKM